MCEAAVNTFIFVTKTGAGGPGAEAQFHVETADEGIQHPAGTEGAGAGNDRKGDHQ